MSSRIVFGAVATAAIGLLLFNSHRKRQQGQRTANGKPDKSAASVVSENPLQLLTDELNEQHARDVAALLNAKANAHVAVASVSYSEVQTALKNSPVFVVFCQPRTKEVVGFARAVTDRVLVGFIEDVVVAPAHRERGLGQRVMTALLAHPALEHVQTLRVACAADEVAFFAQFGFATNLPVSITDKQTDALLLMSLTHSAPSEEVWTLHDGDDDVDVD